MQPWKVSAGLTTAIAGLALLLLGSRMEYLAPFWRLILSDYGVPIAAHLGLALLTVAAILYGAACVFGKDAVLLGDPGRDFQRFLTAPAELPVKVLESLHPSSCSLRIGWMIQCF